MAIHLKAARVNAGYTQDAAAKALNLGKNTIASYEAYKTIPDIETAKRIARLYGMSVDAIIWSAGK